MRILMLLFSDILYDARVRREALSLAKSGIHVDLLCVKQYKEEVPNKLHDNLNVYRTSLSQRRIKRQSPEKKKWRSIHLAKKLIFDVLANIEYYNYAKKKLARKNVYDAIHCHDLNTLPAGYLLKRVMDTKLVFDSHELFNEMSNKGVLEKKIGYFIERILINKTDRLIVVNPIVGNEFVERYGIRDFTVIQNIPDQSTEKSPETHIQLRERFRLSPTDKLIVYQGGLLPDRGIEECVLAISTLPNEYKLILIGSGILEKEIREISKTNRVDDRVFFVGQVPSDELLYFTRQADIGLVMYKNTSRNNYLSTPNKIYEYLLAGIPIVSSDHPGKSSIIQKNNIGVCVKEKPDHIAEGIRSIGEKLEHYKMNCLKAQQYYRWDKEAEKLIDLYKTLVTKP